MAVICPLPLLCDCSAEEAWLVVLGFALCGVEVTAKINYNYANPLVNIMPPFSAQVSAQKEREMKPQKCGSVNRGTR
jgi:hypothetical protein